MLKLAQRCLVAGTATMLALSAGVIAGATEATATQISAPINAGQTHCSTTKVNGVAHQRCTTVSMTSRKAVKNPHPAAAARANARRLTSRPRPQSVSLLCDLGFFNPDRFTSCSLEGWQVTETETVNGETTVIGTLPITIKSSAVFGIDDTASWSLSARVDVGQGTGTLAAGAEGTLSTACGKDPNVCETHTGDEDQPVTFASNSTSGGDWEQDDNGPARTTANTIDTLDGHLGVVLDLDGPPNPVEINDAAGNTLFGRCDNVNPGFDCVDQFGPIAVAFDATSNPLIGPVADHVFNAEKSLPSHWGNPNVDGSALTRTLNQTLIDANRATACVGVAPSCDEYPMASTHQGASVSPVGDWSAVTVPDSANNAQGGVLSQFNRLNRVVENDPFFVLAVRADGSTSW
jgi:hypothetical protein